MSASLKPCPFCGSTDIYHEYDETTGCYELGCNQCGAWPYQEGRKDDVVRKWNTRTAVGDPDFSMAIHDGSAWQKVRECRLPETKVDHGIIEHYGTTAWRLCNECGEEVLARPANFCPSCGAKVAGG